MWSRNWLGDDGRGNPGVPHGVPIGVRIGTLPAIEAAGRKGKARQGEVLDLNLMAAISLVSRGGTSAKLKDANSYFLKGVV